MQHADQHQSSVYQSYLKERAIVVMNKGIQVSYESIRHVLSGLTLKDAIRLSSFLVWRVIT